MQLTPSTKFIFFAIVSLGFGSLIASCSNDGSNTTVGTITGFGSVFVDGVKFNTDTVVINSDGSQGNDPLALLSKGMVVTVTHDGKGNAESIHYQEDLTGPVSSIVDNGATKTLTIFGVDIVVSQDPTVTFIDNDNGLTFFNIARNDLIEVSGYVDNTTLQLNATYIEKEGTYIAGQSDELEIKGTIINMTATTITLALNNTPPLLTVDVNYNRSTEFEDIPSGILTGLYVEVEGTTLSAGGQLLADEIELETDDDDFDDDHIEHFDDDRF